MQTSLLRRKSTKPGRFRKACFPLSPTGRPLIAAIETTVIDFAFIDVSLLFHKDLDIISFFKEHHPATDIFMLCDLQRRSPPPKARFPAEPPAIFSNPSPARCWRHSKKGARTAAEQLELPGNGRARHRESHGDTPEMRKILKTIYKIAPTSTILVARRIRLRQRICK